MSKKVDMDIKVLYMFIQVYCEKKHGSVEKASWEPSEEFQHSWILSQHLLCKDCRDLVEYSSNRRRLCPLDPKPTCRKCKIHCYKGNYRSRIREVMRFSGKHFLKFAIRHGLLKESWEIVTHFI